MSERGPSLCLTTIHSGCAMATSAQLVLCNVTNNKTLLDLDTFRVSLKANLMSMSAQLWILSTMITKMVCSLINND